jgi:membrane-associated protein
MDELIKYICEHVVFAPYVFFLLLLLAGLNIPISEDLLLITGGMISATCAPAGFAVYIFLGLYIGCVVSGWEAYWIGRLLGPKLYQIKWLSYLIHPGRVDKLNRFYEKYGILTFFIVRFIPGGIRNAFFITSGLGRMPFNKFVIRDALACLLSTSVIFYVGYTFAENYDSVVEHFKRYNLIALIVVLVLLITTLSIIYFRKKREKDTL